MFFDSEGLCPRVDEALAADSRRPSARRRDRADPAQSRPVRSRRARRGCAAWLARRRARRRARPWVEGRRSRPGSRLAGSAPQRARAYTPHGGSFNYRPGGAAHRVYMAVERLLAPVDRRLSVRERLYREAFRRRRRRDDASRRVVLNGLRAAEFVRVAANADAAEFIYVGELRAAKGVDTLLEALARLGAREAAASPRSGRVGPG